MDSNRSVDVQDLGLIEYQKAWNYQEELFQKVVSAKQANRNNTEKDPTPNFLLFCQHPHVYTLGKSGKESNLLSNEEFLKKQRCQFVQDQPGWGYYLSWSRAGSWLPNT